MSAAQLAEYKELMHTFHVLQSSDISTAAAMSWVAYDIVLTFGEEIEFIWKAKWSLPKCLYIAARYYGLITLIVYIAVTLLSNPSETLCGAWQWFIGLGVIFFVAVVDLILLLRIDALYGRKKKVFIPLLILYIVEVALATSVGIVVIKQTVQFSKPAYIPITGCYNKPPAHVVLYAWIPSLVIAWIFYGLTVYRLFKELKIQSWFTLTAASGGDHAASMIHIFFRDGSIWFGLAFSVVLITVVFQAVGGVLVALGPQWLCATYSVLGSRLILNLRTASKPDANLDSTGLSYASFEARDNFQVARQSGNDTLEDMDFSGHDDILMEEF